MLISKELYVIPLSQMPVILSVKRAAEGEGVRIGMGRNELPSPLSSRISNSIASRTEVRTLDLP